MTIPDIFSTPMNTNTKPTSFPVLKNSLTKVVFLFPCQKLLGPGKNNLLAPGNTFCWKIRLEPTK